MTTQTTLSVFLRPALRNPAKLKGQGFNLSMSRESNLWLWLSSWIKFHVSSLTKWHSKSIFGYCKLPANQFERKGCNFSMTCVFQYILDLAWSVVRMYSSFNINQPIIKIIKSWKFHETSCLLWSFACAIDNFSFIWASGSGMAMMPWVQEDTKGQ
jgi:hypothetical protein